MRSVASARHSRRCRRGGRNSSTTAGGLRGVRTAWATPFARVRDVFLGAREDNDAGAKRSILPSAAMIQPSRVQVLNDVPIDARGRYVLYWMQQSQRAQFNPALEYGGRG